MLILGTGGMLIKHKFAFIFIHILLILCHMSILFRKMNRFSNFQNNFDIWHDVRSMSSKSVYKIEGY